MVDATDHGAVCAECHARETNGKVRLGDESAVQQYRVVDNEVLTRSAPPVSS